MRIEAILLCAVVALAGCAAKPVENLPVEPAGGLEQFDLDGQPRLGLAEAPVTVLAWEAPACSACKNFHLGKHTGSLDDLTKRYVDPGQVSFVAYQWTIGSGFDDYGGIAQECAYRHGGAGAYFAFVMHVYENQYDQDALLPGLRDAVGAEAADAAASCYEGLETLDAVQADVDLGRKFVGYASPGFMILADGEISGPYGASKLADALEETVTAV